MDEIEEVDAVLGTTSYDKIVDAIEEALKGNKSLEMEDIDLLPMVESKRLVTTGGHFAYLKIAEGCDKHCTYCIIPKIRGNFRSVPMERLLKEAEELVEQGVKELILVAQETTLYGKDIYGEKSLHILLKELFCILIRKRLRMNSFKSSRKRTRFVSIWTCRFSMHVMMC